MDGGAWWAEVHGVAESQTWRSIFIFTFHFHALEKETVTQSSVLAWRIPGTGEPRGLPSMGLHRIRHYWSELAGEGNGNPLQYSCLENPMDGGAWLAAVHGVMKLGTTEWLHFHFSLSCIGEGNGSSLQCSCLENPRDGGAWWAAVYRVTQSQTQLKLLRSSSRSDLAAAARDKWWRAGLIEHGF